MLKRKSLNKIVVDYQGEEKLMLLVIRDTETGNEISGEMESAKKLGFDVTEEIHMDINELAREIQRPDFINKEGFVVVFENGFRVKMKYAEYFRLHKIVSNVNERFVWEFMSQGKTIELENVPDETFQFIKDTQKVLQQKFDAKWQEVNELYDKIVKDLTDVYKEHWTKKEFALAVVPRHKKLSGILFKLYEKRYDEAKEILWQHIRPKYEKGTSGFQSMKMPS